MTPAVKELIEKAEAALQLANVEGFDCFERKLKNPCAFCKINKALEAAVKKVREENPRIVVSKKKG